MDKRYQVFVSSTYEDLQEERREVMQALLKMNCIPTGMELFPAADDDSITLIKRFIAECDYYIVIVGGRYGAIGAAGKSYTEMEYDFATEAGIPILPFLHREPGSIAASKTESTDAGKAALAAFRTRIETGRHAKYWTSPKELAGEVVMGMLSLTKLKPGIGWVRADRVPDESAAQEIVRLQHRIRELEQIVSDAALNPPTGTENLAQGEEPVAITFELSTQRGRQYRPFDFTWNSLLTILGPTLFEAATDEMLKSKLIDLIQYTLNDQRALSTVDEVRDEDLQKVKLQFRALGIIQPARDMGRAGYWKLTPFGDNLMMRVGAISSPKPKESQQETSAGSGGPR